MDYIAGSRRNPFGFDPPCEEFVPGYGVTTADFHVVGDNPAVHGGLSTGIPFTDREWSPDFFDALRRGGLVESVTLDSETVAVDSTFFSYLHMCATDENLEAPDYDALEPFLDSELRAITADVLLPVGARATSHILETYTARTAEALDMDARHAEELRGSGWLVIPIKDPVEWTGDDGDQLAEQLSTLQESDYRRLADLGRFSHDDDPYLVR